jgi:hypothetical protein
MQGSFSHMYQQAKMQDDLKNRPLDPTSIPGLKAQAD